MVIETTEIDFSHSPGEARNLRSRCYQGVEVSLLASGLPPSLCIFTWSSVHVHICVLMSSKDTRETGLGPNLRTSF